MGPSKQLLQLAIDKSVIELCKKLHRAYNHKTGLNLSFTKFAEGMLTSYLHTQTGKDLFHYATKRGITGK